MPQLITSINTKFGMKETESKLVIKDESLLLHNNYFQAPFEILASSSLIKELEIPADIVFQLLIMKERPTVGLLLGEKIKNRISTT
jgi:hypothetical protein